MLENGARIAVIGGGPAGSLFSHFLLATARTRGVDAQVDIYEPREFSAFGPGGCNMCGGIVSNSLLQMLAEDGIELPPSVVRASIDSYVLHTEFGTAQVGAPLQEMRIGAVYRGGGPCQAQAVVWESFDGYLLDLARRDGANVIRARVDELGWDDGRPRVHARGRTPETYDLLVGAVGINSSALRLFEGLGFGYRPPRITRAFIAEFYLGQEQVSRYLGSSMHVFLSNIPGLEFAVLIPKGECVSMALLGRDLDREVVNAFLRSPEVRSCLPPDQGMPDAVCHCSPHIYEEAAVQPFGDRVVLVGDCSVSRLYKNGLGAAYRTARAAATTAILHGVSKQDFQRHYWPECRRIVVDNRFGRLVFFAVAIIRKLPFACRAVGSLIRREQNEIGPKRRMSMVLWDIFTGSAPYTDIFLRAVGPGLVFRLIGEAVKALVPRPARALPQKQGPAPFERR